MKTRVVAAAVLAGAALAFAATGGSADKSPKSPKPFVVEGKLIDTKCYSMSNLNSGDDHGAGDDMIEACATACAKMGIPVAVLTAKGEVYILLAPSEAFEDHMAGAVRVTGTKVYHGSAIRPDKVEVREKDGSWTAVDIRSMM
jgi:hypothetical protein